MYFLLVIVIYFFDQISKLFIRNNLSLGESVPIVNNFLHLTLVHNNGAAFGIFQDHPGIFSYIAGVSALIMILLLTLKRNSLNSIEKISLCFILSGTFGNLTDRLRFGYVIDFLDFRIWPVFNIADSFITIGALTLGSYLIYTTYKDKRAA